jgi:uncharacterized protein
MNRVIIVHGWGGSSKSDFLPWVKKELEKLGYEVIVPDMPDPDNPKIETWVPYLTKIISKPRKTDIFVGHSVGCQTVLRFLETLSENQKVDKVILIAPWGIGLTNLEEGEDEIAKPWLETPIDFKKVKSKAKVFIALFSDNDPFVSLQENKKMFEVELEAEVLIEHNKGHFNNMPKERPVILNLF